VLLLNELQKAHAEAERQRERISVLERGSTRSSALIVERISTERKRKRFDPRVEDVDRERPIDDRLRLPDQLIEPLLTHDSVAVWINVDAVRRTRSVPVDGDSKPDRRSSRGRAQDQVQIARVKPVRDLPACSVQQRGFRRDRPFAGKSPLVQAETDRKAVRLNGVPRGATRRGEVVRFLTADVRFGRLQTVPVCANFQTLRLDAGSFTIDAASGVRQELANPRFRFFVVALAEVVVTNTPLGIEKVQRGPVVVRKAPPDRAITYGSVRSQLMQV